MSRRSIVAVMVVVAMLGWLAPGTGGAVHAQQPRASTIEALRQQSQKAFEAEDYQRAFGLARNLAAEVEAAEKAAAGQAGAKTATALGEFAWHALAAGQADTGLDAAARGYRLAPEQHWIECNRILALVLLGRTGEALETYQSNLQRPLSPGAEKSWQDAIEDDLGELLQRGVGRPQITAFINSASGLLPQALLKKRPSIRAEREVMERNKETNARLTALQAAGKSSEALAIYRQTIDQLQRALGRDHKLVGLWLRGLADYQFSIDPTVDGRPLYRRALEIAERYHGPDHPETILPLQTLALLDMRAGDFQSARHHLERAASVAERRGVTLAKHLSETIGQIAELEHARKRPEAALNVLRSGLQKVTALAGAQSEAVALARVNLADQLMAGGNCKEADVEYAMALPVLEAMPKPDHLLISTALSSRALCMTRISRPPLERLAISRKQIAHLEVAEEPRTNSLLIKRQHALWLTRVQLAQLLTETGGYEEAEVLLRGALKFRENEETQYPQQVAAVLSALGFLMAMSGRWYEALPFHERALQLRETLSSPEDSNIAVTLSQLGLTHNNLGQHDKAEHFFRRQIDVLKKERALDARMIALAYNNLASALTRLERMREAGEYHTLAVASLEGAQTAQPLDLPQALEGLSHWQKAMGRYVEAVATARRALALREERFGKSSPDTEPAVTTLALMLERAGQTSDAELLYRRAIEILENAPKHGVAQHIDIAKGNLANLLTNLGRFDEAAQLHEVVLHARKLRSGEQSSLYARALSGYSNFLGRIGSDAAALVQAERALKIVEELRGASHPEVAIALNNVAIDLGVLGRYADAERALSRALEINQRARGDDAPETLANLHNIGSHLKRLGRYSEAAALFRTVAGSRERLFGASHPLLANTLGQLAEALSSLNEHEEAIQAAQRSLAIVTSLYGDEHLEVAVAHGTLGNVYGNAGRYADSLGQQQAGLDIKLKLLAPTNPQVITSYNNVGFALENLGRVDDAEQIFRTAVGQEEKAVGSGAQATQAMRENLAFLLLRRGDWFEAIREIDAVLNALLASAPSNFTSTNELSERLQAQLRGSSVGIIHATAMALKEGRELTKDAERAVFDALQRYVAGAASSRLDQVGRRLAAKDSRTSMLIRERQDLGYRIVVLDRQITASLASETRDKATLARLRQEFNALQDRQAAIEVEIRSAFPAYFDLVRPKPLSIREMQSLLREREVAVVIATARTAANHTRVDPRTGIVLAITRDSHRFVHIDLTQDDLEADMHALRCGLDAAAWGNPVLMAADRKSSCPELVGQGAPSDGVPPFDLDRAHRMYQSIFGGIKDLVEGRDLLIMADYPMANFPWSVLVRSAPPSRFASAADMRNVDWLGLATPIAVLPSPAALRVLRKMSRPSQAKRAWVGFGNPVLNGVDDRFADMARMARERDRCGSLPQRRRDIAALPRALRGANATTPTRDVILSQAPLPETADELCAVGATLGADVGDIHIGSNASKTLLRDINRTGRLAQYRLLHFATHAAKVGELAPGAEPGLILTPAADKADDDGYLTASEIAELKLDADWVILSACNTASSGGDGAALSGLAQAFLFAGSRALLVSHWYVDSEATVRLIQTTLQAYAAHPNVNRAEALRAGMRALVFDSNPENAHPSKWAPFVVVGEPQSLH